MGKKHVLAGLAVICVGGGVAVGGLSLARPQDTRPPLPVARPTPPPVPELTTAERLAVAMDVSSAVRVLRPTWKDTTEDPDPGAAALAVWAKDHLRWNDMMSLPETKRAAIMKDPEAARGRRTCVGGTIIEIHTDRSAGSPIYTGGIVTAYSDVVRFMAVRSSGDLVQHSLARICGVIIGLQSYSNVSGGKTHAVSVVGMFDLPENRDTR